MFNNINKILHPTDFSPPANNAYSYAIEIAHQSNADLLVLHSTKPSYNYGSDKMMEEILSKNKYKDLTIETRIEFGDTVNDIINAGADLIIMGSKGKTNMEKMLLGNISSQIIMKSPVPVMVVPAKRPYSNFSNFVFATDYNDRDLKLLQQLTQWADLFNTELTVLHIAEKDNLKSQIQFRGFKEIAKEEVSYSKMNFRLIFNKDFYTGISAFLHGQADTLIVMVRYKKSFFRSLVDEDHIQKTVYSQIPLLVLPGKVITEHSR